MSTLIFTPSNPFTYYPDPISIKVSGAVSYIWSPIESEFTPNGCNPTSNTDTLNFIPQKNIQYKVTGTDSFGNEIIEYIDILVKNRPMKILDRELIPVVLYNYVINRNEKKIIEILNKNIILRRNLTQFFKIQLPSQYSYAFQGKIGRGFRIPWYSILEEKNQNGSIIISFEEQWKLYKYLILNSNKFGNSDLNYLWNIMKNKFFVDR